MVADRHLLFGLLALQNGMINQGQLLAAFQAWTLERSKSLAEHLARHGDLNGEDRAAIEALAARHVKRHGDDLQHSLATLEARGSIRERLTALADADIEASLVHVGSASTHSNDDIDRTATYSVGTAPDGQRFRILRPHAKGGLGAVFVALDQELHREVALKQILDKHADDPFSRARFVLEAEITGGLEHPGIVPVYGLGCHADGRPYYAMRFINGDSLKEVVDRFRRDAASKRELDQHSLELRQLLRRFVDVCNAIEYAHSRGVLHRDIKPANMIVGRYGETLVVDWGLAKPLGHSELGVEGAERTLIPSAASGTAATLPGSALGTPAYMSPEQAHGDLNRLSPRSDVYSLGATLYYVLTGRPPVAGDLAEVLRDVQQGKIQPPREVDPEIDQALEAVCLKAMAREPEARYPTARAVAEDIDRWMADEPVAAWREPISTRARRWARRNRWKVTAASVVLLVTLVGTGASLAVQTRANAQLKRANTNLAIANRKVTQANAALQAANDQVRQRFDLALDAIKLFHGDVSQDLLLKEKEFARLRSKLLTGAAEFYGKLQPMLQSQSDPASQQALGRAYSELGALTSQIGSFREAAAVHRKGLAVRRALAARRDAGPEALLDLAHSLNELAFDVLGAKDVSGALALRAEARGLAEDLIRRGEGGNEAQSVLADSLAASANFIGSTRDGLQMARRAREILVPLVQKQPHETRYLTQLSETHYTVAYLLSKLGRQSEAITSYEECAAVARKLIALEPDAFHFQDHLARTYSNLASIRSEMGHEDESIAYQTRAVEIWKKAYEANPATRRLLNNLVFGLNLLARRLIERGRPFEALVRLRQAQPLLAKLVELDPSANQGHVSLNYTLTIRALAFLGSWRDVQELYDKGVWIGQKVEEAPFYNNGWSFWRLGHAAEAVSSFDRARKTFQRRATGASAQAVDRDTLANCETNISAALTALGRFPDARACCERAIAIREELVKVEPNNEDYTEGLAESLMRRGGVKRATGDDTGAVADWRRAMVLFASHPPVGEAAILRACCHGSLASLAGVPGSGVLADEGLKEADEAMAILRGAGASGFRDSYLLRVEPGLNALRHRADFQQLVTDLVFPTDPFAHHVEEYLPLIPGPP
jgi:serine/threonine-protein kinase